MIKNNCKTSFKKIVESSKFIQKKDYIFLFLILILTTLFCFFIAKDKSYFLRDDFDILLIAKNFSFEDLLKPHGEHFYPISRLLFAIEFKLFKLNYPAYLKTTMFFHLLNIVIVFIICKQLKLNRFVTFAVTLSFAIPGTSYKIFTMFVNQTWVLQTFFSTLAFLYVINYQQKRKQKFYFLAILSTVIASLIYTTGIASLLAVLFFGLLQKKTTKKMGLIIAFCALVFFFLYLLLPREPKSGFNSIYPLLIFRLVFLGTFLGTILQSFYPWFSIWRSFKELLLIISFTVFITIFFKNKLLGKINCVSILKKEKNYLLISVLLIFFHFALIGIGRFSNIGYAFSPQYNYLTRLIFLIMFFFFLNKILQTAKIGNYLIIGFFSLWITLNQLFYFYYQMNKWHKRGVYTRQFFKQLGNIAKIEGEILNLDCPDSISPNLKFSDMIKLFYQNEEVTFVESNNSADFLEKIKENKDVFNFYKNSLEKKDIYHY